MEKIEICEMTLADYEQIKDVLISEFDDFWSPRLLKSEIAQKNRIYLVAKQHEKIVGFAGGMINFPDFEMMNLVIRKTNRKKGIGKFLLEKLIEIAQKNSIENVILEVNETNKIARKLYGNAGFEETGMRKKYYQSTDNAILMSKKVNKL